MIAPLRCRAEYRALESGKVRQKTSRNLFAQLFYRKEYPVTDALTHVGQMKLLTDEGAA